MHPTSFDRVMKREYSMLYAEIAVQTLADFIRQELGENVVVRGEGEGGWLTLFAQKGKLPLVSVQMVKEMKESAAVTMRRVEHMHEVGKNFVDFCRNIPGDDRTAKRCAVILDEYHKQFFLYGVELWRSFYLVMAGETVFKEGLARHIPIELIPQAIEQLSFPSNKASLFQITDYFVSELDAQKRKEYVCQYFPWIHCGDVITQSMNDQQLTDFVSAFAVKQAPAHKFSIVLNPEASELVAFYQKMLFVKDVRDDYRREAFYYSIWFFEQIARHLGIKHQDVGLFTFTELGRFLRQPAKSALNKLLLERRRAYLIEYDGQIESIKNGESAKLEFFPDDHRLKAELLEGSVGSRGVVSGKVQLIQNRLDIQKFKAGYVLVSVTTNPDYIPAMQKAVAFITDEGGITCHAAIVARELGKPCVVGTKIATKVLKDGMMVEVDAENGIVRIL